MIVRKSVSYICEICKEEFDSVTEARDCENKPIKHDKGAKVGSKIRILAGDSPGSVATVKRIWYAHISWGGPCYYHTPVMEVEIDGTPYSTTLTWNMYEMVKSEKNKNTVDRHRDNRTRTKKK